MKKVQPGRGRQAAHADKGKATSLTQEQKEMNASFGRHSGRGARREEFYQFKRQDSNDSSKLQERLRRSQEGLRNATNSEGPHRKGGQPRRRYGAQNSDYDGQTQTQFG